MVASVASGPDLVRLIIVPVLGWAAWRDYRTRRIPSGLWWPLIGLGILVLAWEGWTTLTAQDGSGQLFLLRIVISVGLLGLLAWTIYRLQLMGTADAKAIVMLAVVFPTYPAYELGQFLLPIVRPPLGVFSLTVLTNTALLGLLYPVTLAARNLLDGETAALMFIARRIHWSAVPRTHGRLAERPEGHTLYGLDLDTVRMYLRWRKTTFEALRERRSELRDPETVPETPGAPTDGRPDLTRGLESEAAVESLASRNSVGTDSQQEYADPWAAEEFISCVDSAYGASPRQLREGLELLSGAEKVWVSPGLPYLVLVFLGLVVGFGYGDLLFAGMQWVGLM